MFSYYYFRRLIIILFAFVFITTLHAQPILDSSDFIFPTQKIKLKSASNVSNIDFQLTGANVTWNYAQLMTNDSYIDTFVSVFNSPSNYAFFYILNSNLACADKTGLNLLNGLQQNPWNFYRKTATKLQQSGYAGEINGIPTPTIYSTPDVLYKFPLKFGNRDSSTAKYTLPASVIIGATTVENKSRVNIVDGWGKLITPFDTINQVLRIHSEINIQDSITINGTGLNVTTQTLNEYKFVAKGLDWPILQIYTSKFFGVEIVSKVIVRDTIFKHALLNGIANFSANHDVKIFPNPVRNVIHVQLDKSLDEGLKNIYIYDILGRVVKLNSFQGTQSITDLSGISNGIYFIKIETPEYTIVNKFLKD